MRNPARIYPLLNKIGDIWVKMPDIRLGQLISNITHPSKIDIFYMEDEELEKKIDDFGKKINNT